MSGIKVGFFFCGNELLNHNFRIVISLNMEVGTIEENSAVCHLYFKNVRSIVYLTTFAVGQTM
jgi:hypothetical protein